MNPRVQYFACAFLLIYLGKGVHVANGADEDNCWMKDTSGTNITSYLDDFEIDDVVSGNSLKEFKIVNTANKEVLPEVYDVDKNAKSKYMRVDFKDKANDLYTLKVTDEIARYVANEDKPTLQIKIVYICKTPQGDKTFEKSVVTNVKVKSAHSPNPTFEKSMKDTFEVPLPLIKGVQVPGVDLEVEYLSYNKLSVIFEPAGHFEVWDLVNKGSRKYSVSLKTMQVINFPGELNVTIIAKDSQDESKKVSKIVTLKVNEKDSVPLLSGIDYIDQRTCSKNGEKIGEINYPRGDQSPDVKIDFNVVPADLKSHFSLGLLMEKKVPILLQSCPELKELEKTNIVTLTVTAKSKGATSDLTVPIIFSNSPLPAPNDGGGHGGLTAALVIFILISIGTTAGLVYFWRKVRNMSSSFP